MPSAKSKKLDRNRVDRQLTFFRKKHFFIDLQIHVFNTFNWQKLVEVGTATLKEHSCDCWFNISVLLFYHMV